jgi:archaellum component FlaC
MKQKNMTIEDLARMVQNSFADAKTHTDEQFAQVDKQFAKVDQQFVGIRHEMAEFRSEVDQRFTQVHHELRSIRKELEGVVYRPEFEALQDQVRDMQRVLSTFKKKAA